MKSSLGLLFAMLAPLAGASSDPSAGVLAAEAARGQALRSGNAEALATLLSDDLRYIHSTGKVEGKSDAVNALAGRTVAYERFESSELHATVVAPGVVVLTGKIDQRKLSGGKWTEARLLFHAVWRTESGQWRLISLQTALPPAPKS